ncbi:MULTISPECIES: glycosyltransferase family 39 protein [unclassified Achromobacter]|uniref:ArnT family glycosyltransferase n=1 Tax=unclassified Achromobacter TaxID=2626865 RepID=UPI000B517E2F|nr:MULTISPECIES: glycosyltransferase family 39 protein [unclassified Achromobacter]OWT74496.1 dolichyl-phosphate-mannose--protein mannosyltransferase [Achromobacter sp. HZ34]OWT78963.1 dolichyl-phosphate-mannose--protein mannosyltransferase [Achromobacter sp. HZ28]
MSAFVSSAVAALRRWIAAPSDIVVFLGTGIWLLFLIGLRPLTMPDEGRYGGVAWEMLTSGLHLVPTLDGMPFFHKPPLYYWMAEAAYALFGAHVWTARLPSWLAAWAVAMVLYAFLRRWRGPMTATVALLALITQPIFFGAAQFANLDMLVAGLIGMTILVGASVVLRASAGQPYRALSLLVGVLAGLGVLAKGLIGLVLPGAVLVLWLVLRRRWRGFSVLLWPPVLAVFLAMTLPWFWVMQTRFPDFLHYFFVYQQFERFAATGFNNVQPFWFYLPVVAALAVPWTLWLGGAMRKEFWRNTRRPSPARPVQMAATLVDMSADVRWLMVCWLAVILVFFSLPASKLIGYILPVLPAVAALAAEVIIAGVTGAAPRRDKSNRRFAFSLTLAVLFCVGGTVIATVKARPNSVDLGRAASAEMDPADTLIALHVYPYDLPMTLRLAAPMWVVDDWTQADIPTRDNWRKELFDAGRFDGAAMQRNLISEQEMTRRLCANAVNETYWVWGEPSRDATRYAILRDRAPRYTDSRRALWRIDVDNAFRQAHCAAAVLSASEDSPTRRR